MADLQAAFDAAVASSKTLPDKPDNMTLLKVYGLFKQSTAGDAEGKAPSSPTSWAAPSSAPGPRSKARQRTTRCRTTST